MPNIHDCHLCNASFLNNATFSFSLKSLICSSCDNHDLSEFNVSIDAENLNFLDLINKTNINQIEELKISAKRLYEIYIFLISFTRCHIQYINNIKGLSEIEKIYYEH